MKGIVLSKKLKTQCISAHGRAGVYFVAIVGKPQLHSLSFSGGHIAPGAMWVGGCLLGHMVFGNAILKVPVLDGGDDISCL